MRSVSWFDPFWKTLLLATCVLLFSPSVLAEKPETSMTAFLRKFPGMDYDWQVIKVFRSPVGVPKTEAQGAALPEDDLVLGVDLAGHAVAYPIRYLALVEVINDFVGGQPILVTWCPLTGSARAFEIGSLRAGRHALISRMDSNSGICSSPITPLGACGLSWTANRSKEA